MDRLETIHTRRSVRQFAPAAAETLRIDRYRSEYVRRDRWS